MTDANITIVLLPGMNGTQGLFQPLIDSAPEGFNLFAIDYPTHENYSYELLVDYVLQKISHLQGGFVLLGESFSGSLALFIAQTKPKGLMGVILVATFITSPHSKLVQFFPWALIFAFGKLFYALILFFSSKRSMSLMKLVSQEVQKVAPTVLAHRVQSASKVNAETALKSCAVPIMYFRGKKDFVVPKKNLAHILSIKPDVKIVEFNTQHFLLQTAPARAWAAISEFTEPLVQDN